ncbi:hypothetical protein N7465_006998 [Penicillium sp. CMV-2018d]|nr:hypothetical protein N7465_006998 [Penicillium sp. CMV-2018d]
MLVTMRDLENNTYPLYGPDEPPDTNRLLPTLAISSQYPYGLVLRRYWKPMLGTCKSFSLIKLCSAFLANLSSNNTTGQNIGYRTTTLGFMIWAIWGFILGAALQPIQSVFPLFVVIYNIFQALGEMALSFPTPLRDHFLGFAAAVGKAGASIGTVVFFTPIQNSFDTTAKGQQAVFLIGAAFTVFLIPDMSRELETEEAKFRAYLEENGYDVSVYGEALVVNARAST